MSEYKSSDVQKLFAISHETVRRWAEEYEEYLSTGANPGKGKHRVFNDEDLRVFAMVTGGKADDMSDDDIHASLKAGQRGDLPSMLDERSLEIGMNLQITIARQQINQLQQQLDRSVEEAQEWRDKANQLQGRVEALDAQIKQATESQANFIQLHTEIARLKLLLELEKEKNKEQSQGSK